MDARFDTPFANKGVCNVPPSLGNLGIAGAMLIKPGDNAGSIVWQRLSQRGTGVEMPPLASTLVDAAGSALLEQWIDSLSGCPTP
jgi:hypothetical protein